MRCSLTFAAPLCSVSPGFSTAHTPGWREPLAPPGVDTEQQRAAFGQRRAEVATLVLPKLTHVYDPLR